MNSHCFTTQKQKCRCRCILFLNITKSCWVPESLSPIYIYIYFENCFSLLKCLCLFLRGGFILERKSEPANNNSNNDKPYLHSLQKFLGFLTPDTFIYIFFPLYKYHKISTSTLLALLPKQQYGFGVQCSASLQRQYLILLFMKFNRLRSQKGLRVLQFYTPHTHTHKSGHCCGLVLSLHFTSEHSLQAGGGKTTDQTSLPRSLIGEPFVSHRMTE